MEQQQISRQEKYFHARRVFPFLRDLNNLQGQGQSQSIVNDFLKICSVYEVKTRGEIIAEQDEYADSLYVPINYPIDSGQFNTPQTSNFLIRDPANLRCELNLISYQYIDNQQTFDFPGQFIPTRYSDSGTLTPRHRWLGDTWVFRPGVHEAVTRASKEGFMFVVTSRDFLGYLNRHPAALPLIFNYLSRNARRYVLTSQYAASLTSNQRRNGMFGGNLGVDQDDVIEISAPEVGGSDDEPRIGRELTRDQIYRARRAGLQPGEYIAYFFSRSPTIFTFWSVFYVGLSALVFILAMILAFQFSNQFGLNSLLIVLVGVTAASFPLIPYLIYVINWRNAFFIITTQRLILYQLDIFRFRNDVQKVEIDKVQSVAIKKDGFFLNLLGIGSVDITTGAAGVIQFDYIDYPELIEEAIQIIQSSSSRIDESRLRKEMRDTVDAHFRYEADIEEVKDLQLPKKRPPFAFIGDFTKTVRELFVQKIEKDSVTYHRHPIQLVRDLIGPTIMALLLGISWLVIRTFFPEFLLFSVYLTFGVLVFVNLLWTLWQIEDWRNDTFQVTTRYIYDIDRKPLGFREDRKVAELNRIENIRTEQDGIFPNLFGYGNVSIETAGADSNLVFENVRNPRQVQDQIFAFQDRFNRQQEERLIKAQLDQTVTLIEMYEERKVRGWTQRPSPLPDIPPDDDIPIL